MGKIKSNDYIYLCSIAYIIGLLCTGLFSVSQGLLFLTTVFFLTIISLSSDLLPYLTKQ